MNRTNAWLALAVIAGGARIAMAQAGVTRAAAISRAVLEQSYDFARASRLARRPTVRIAIDTVARPSHVGRGALVGLSVGLVFAVFKVAQASNSCQRSSCDGGPFLDPLVDPIVYGGGGATLGAVTMWLWSLR